jgi:hypothetical protein
MMGPQVVLLPSLEGMVCGETRSLWKMQDMVEVQEQEKQRLKAIENNVKGLKKRTETTTKARKSSKRLSKARQRRIGLK